MPLPGSRAARVALALFAAFLTGCASTYGRNLLFGGFSEDKLSDNSYRVAYSGNGYTNDDMVEVLAASAERRLTSGCLPGGAPSPRPPGGVIVM